MTWGFYPDIISGTNFKCQYLKNEALHQPPPSPAFYLKFNVGSMAYMIVKKIETGIFRVYCLYKLFH